MDIDKYRKMFLSEAGEHLQMMADLLVKVEADPENRDLIDALFREAHSIKGMAATMSYDATARLAHHLEDQLDSSRSEGLITSAMIDRMLAGVDLIEGLLQDIECQQPERDVEAFIEDIQPLMTLEPIEQDENLSEQDEGPGKTRILLRLADTVAAPGPRLLVMLKQLAGLGDVLDAKPSEEKILQGETSRVLDVELMTALSEEDLRRHFAEYGELKAIDFPTLALGEKGRPKGQSASSTVRVDTDLLDRFINLTGELITNRYMLQSAASERDWSELNEGLGQLARLVKNLHHQVLQVRMMPLESVTGRLPRAVRDLCRATGKEIQLEVVGGTIELDRAILEELTDPLTHMLRNAIDHGIEKKGAVQVKAWRERDQVLIQVSDDGCGIDPEYIRKRAVERNLISPAQAQSMRDYDALQLICHPGFSTVEKVTETSGRGVGMDVVKTAVERLGGVLLIDSTPGEGARFTMKLPLSVAIIRVLLIECADSLLGMPITRVLQTLEVAPEEVQTSGKQLVISLNGELLPLLSLRKILSEPKGPSRNLLPLVVTEVFGRKVGLVVDGLVGQQEVFVQALPKPFDCLRGNSGGAILGDGRVLFLLDLQSKLEKRRAKGQQ